MRSPKKLAINDYFLLKEGHLAGILLFFLPLLLGAASLCLYRGTGYPPVHSSGDKMPLQNNNTRGRHRPGSVQLKAWLPKPLRDDFTQACKSQGMCASAVLRGLLLAYIESVAKAVDG